MPAALPQPIIYLITSGATTTTTTPNDSEFSDILRLVESATTSNIPLVQIREKRLPARALYELTSRAAAITRGTSTRLLVNDRVDIACAAGADGVQLTSQSLSVDLTRRVAGADFLVGVSTHSLREAATAREEGANFVVFGPVFETESKRVFGPPQGIEKLREVTSALGEFPVVAIGGIGIDQVAECFASGAQGIAAIRLLREVSTLSTVVTKIREMFDKL